MASSTVVAFRNAFATAIGAQLTSDGTTGVTVNKYGKVAVDWEDTITLLTAEADQDHLTMGGSRQETYTMSGVILAPKSGGTLDEASEGETRGLLILASIENTLRDDPTVSSSVFHAEVASYKSDVVIDERGYVGQVEFTIDVTANI